MNHKVCPDNIKKFSSCPAFKLQRYYSVQTNYVENHVKYTVTTFRQNSEHMNVKTDNASHCTLGG